LPFSLAMLLLNEGKKRYARNAINKEFRIIFMNEN